MSPEWRDPCPWDTAAATATSQTSEKHTRGDGKRSHNSQSTPRHFDKAQIIISFNCCYHSAAKQAPKHSVHRSINQLAFVSVRIIRLTVGNWINFKRMAAAGTIKPPLMFVVSNFGKKCSEDVAQLVAPSKVQRGKKPWMKLFKSLNILRLMAPGETRCEFRPFFRSRRIALVHSLKSP